MIDLPIAILLSPLLILQGRWVRAKTPTLAEPDGEREGHFGSGPTLRLMIIGDSAAAGVGVVDQAKALSGQLVRQLGMHYSVEWRLIAKTGATTDEALSWLEIMEVEPFDAIVLSLGANDITSGVTRNGWVKKQERILRMISSKFDPQLVIISGMPPMGRFTALPQPLKRVLGMQSDRYNHVARATWGDHTLCHFLEPFNCLKPKMMATDGYHPGEEIYSSWATAITDVIRVRFTS